MFTIRLQLCLLLLQFLSHVHGQLSDLRRCADPQCQKVIAEARTTVKYVSGHRGVLSFPNNAAAKIYSKDAGSNLDWWGVEINGKRAYAPKKFLREDRVLVPDKLLQHVVPVDEISLISSNAQNKNTNSEKIDKIEKVKLTENLTDDDEEEADGGEEFLDEDDEEDEEPEGIQVYNAGANSPSNPEQEKSALPEETSTGQPSVAEAKPGEHSTASEEISSGSAKDSFTNVSPSSVDFEVVDGTTIFGDPVDTTPTPPNLHDYETPPPLYASTTNTVQTTTATPPLSPSVHTASTVPEVGSDSSTTPELQVVPSGLPLSSLASREAPVSATPAPVMDGNAAASVAHVDSSILNSVETSSSDAINSETAPPSHVMNPEAVSVSEEGAGITRTKSEVADDNQENPGKNDIHSLNNSDSKLNSDTPAVEVNEAGNVAASEESNSPSTGDGSPAVESNFVPFSPIVKVDSPTAELNTDHIVEEVLHDSDDSIGKSNGIDDQAVDGDVSEHASIALQSDDPVSDAEGTNPELEDNSSDVPEDGGGSIFDSWLSGWSSAEDDSGTDVEASEEPSKESSSQSQPGVQSELGNIASSGDGAVDDLTNSVGEVSFISAADRVTASEHSTSFETTTEGVAATVTEGAAIDGPEVVQENAGHSDVGEAVRGSESASDFVATSGSLDGEPLENVVSSSPIPELRDVNLDFGEEKLDTFMSETENVNVATESSVIHPSQPPADASVPHTGISEPLTETSGPVTDASEPVMNGVSQPTTDASESGTDVSESVPDASESVTDASESVPNASESVTDASESVTDASELVTGVSESVADASEHLTDSSASISGDSVLVSPMADLMVEMPNSADQLAPGEMVSSSSGEQPADVFDAIADSSGDTSGAPQVDGDGARPEAKPDAPDMLTSESAGGASDLHDPESLTGHLLKTVEPILGESLSLALEHDLSSPVASSGAVAAVVVLALTILLLYAASALITKCSREGPLLKALNVLEHEQHTAEQLIADLQSKLSAGHTQAGSLAESSEATRVMAQQLQQAQEENVALAERVQDLEQQLEESTSSGLEMDNMLQELLLSQKDTTSFQEAIDSLQQMLDSQREKVESLTADLSIKTTLNEELRGESATAKERIRKLEYQLDQVTQSLEEVNSAKAQVVAQLAAEQGRLQHVTEERDVLARSSSDASAALAALTEQHSGAQSKAQQLRSTLKTKEAELQVTKECLKQLKVFNNDGKAAKEKLAQLLDSVKARSELACAVEDRRTLEADLQQRSEQVAQLERRVQQAQEEAEQCRKDQAAADQEKREALSKLAVLTDYFHEKEAQLTKELESESGLRLDAEGSAESITSRMRDYDMQLLAYKTQVNTLKKELEDQELSFKTQLAAQEQKAHESWVSARAAERKYEESKQETAQMRSRLLLMSKDNSEQHAIIKPTPQHAETSNGSVSSPRPPLHDDLDGEHSHPLDSPPPIPPPHMLPHLFPPPPNLPPGMPPPFPPPHFLPPPLPPPMMADRRLPPAGRLASPPFHRRMGAASPPEFMDRRSPPHFDRRSYSPASSRYSDRQGRYSPDRHGRYSPERHGRYSPERHGRYSPDRQGRFSPGRYSPDRLSDRMYDRHHHNDRYNNIDRHSDAYSSNGRNDSQRESSPERPYNRSPEGFARKASPPPLHRRLYDEGGGPPTRKGKKTSTPLGPNDR